MVPHTILDWFEVAALVATGALLALRCRVVWLRERHRFVGKRVRLVKPWRVITVLPVVYGNSAPSADLTRRIESVAAAFGPKPARAVPVSHEALREAAHRAVDPSPRPRKESA